MSLITKRKKRFIFPTRKSGFNFLLLKKYYNINEWQGKRQDIFYELNISVFEEVLIWIKGLGGA